MTTLLIVLHVIFCVFLILVILLQTGKGAGIGAAFGGGSSQTVFGPRGAGSFIGKLTGIVAGLFMVTSLVLAYVSSSKDTGLAEKGNALNAMRSGQGEEVDLDTFTAVGSEDTAATAPEAASDEPKASDEVAADAAVAPSNEAAPSAEPATEPEPAAKPAAAPAEPTPAEPAPDAPAEPAPAAPAEPAPAAAPDAE